MPQGNTLTYVPAGIGATGVVGLCIRTYSHTRRMTQAKKISADQPLPSPNGGKESDREKFPVFYELRRRPLSPFSIRGRRRRRRRARKNASRPICRRRRRRVWPRGKEQSGEGKGVIFGPFFSRAGAHVSQVSVRNPLLSLGRRKGAVF